MVPTLTGPVLESAIILMIDRGGHNETPKLLRVSGHCLEIASAKL